MPEFLWQICSGIDENAVGACSELVFAPIDEMFPDDAPLLPSGFRIIPLDSKTVEFLCATPEKSCSFVFFFFFFLWSIS
jgi:hypothetical protein